MWKSEKNEYAIFKGIFFTFPHRNSNNEISLENRQNQFKKVNLFQASTRIEYG